jgi:hypothetical protein
MHGWDALLEAVRTCPRRFQQTASVGHWPTWRGGLADIPPTTEGWAPHLLRGRSLGDVERGQVLCPFDHRWLDGVTTHDRSFQLKTFWINY